MGNWNNAPAPPDVHCPHCAADGRMIERRGPWLWICNCCARAWPVVTLAASVKDEPQAT